MRNVRFFSSALCLRDLLYVMLYMLRQSAEAKSSSYGTERVCLVRQPQLQSTIRLPRRLDRQYSLVVVAALAQYHMKCLAASSTTVLAACPTPCRLQTGNTDVQVATRLRAVISLRRVQVCA